LPRRETPLEAVVLGSSTGGPDALSVVLSQLPADLGVPVFVVQHMPALFTKILADRLDSSSALTVGEAVDGARPLPGHVYIAPGDFHMQVRRDALGVKIRLDQGPQENFCRPAVDVLFRSAADAYGGGALAVMLTGMGQDGVLGVRRLKEVGVLAVVQDEATSVVWGMPGAVAQAGLADQVLPLGEIATAISGAARSGRAAGAAV
jgi:two-component system chemotaxis response regulator CheB